VVSVFKDLVLLPGTAAKSPKPRDVSSPKPAEAWTPAFFLRRRRFSRPRPPSLRPESRLSRTAAILASRASIFPGRPPSWRPRPPSLFPDGRLGVLGLRPSSQAAVLASPASVFLGQLPSWRPRSPSFFPSRRPGVLGLRLSSDAAVLRSRALVLPPPSPSRPPHRQSSRNSVHPSIFWRYLYRHQRGHGLGIENNVRIILLTVCPWRLSIPRIRGPSEDRGDGRRAFTSGWPPGLCRRRDRPDGWLAFHELFEN
jgi:hypothetical protein